MEIEFQRSEIKVWDQRQGHFVDTGKNLYNTINSFAIHCKGRTKITFVQDNVSILAPFLLVFRGRVSISPKLEGDFREVALKGHFHSFFRMTWNYLRVQ